MSACNINKAKPAQGLHGVCNYDILVFWIYEKLYINMQTVLTWFRKRKTLYLYQRECGLSCIYLIILLVSWFLHQSSVVLTQIMQNKKNKKMNQHV